MAWNKYGNHKVYIGTDVFDSKKEANRWTELQWLEKAGKISELRRQVAFELIPRQEFNGKFAEHPVKYLADFVYRDENGNVIVEDTKSKATRTKDYVIKRKLMLYRYGYRIREV